MLVSRGARHPGELAHVCVCVCQDACVTYPSAHTRISVSVCVSLYGFSCVQEPGSEKVRSIPTILGGLPRLSRDGGS